MDYSKTITGIMDVPAPKKFEVDIKTQQKVDTQIEGLPADWLISDVDLNARLSANGLSMAFRLFGTSPLGVVSTHDVGRFWRPTALDRVRWSFQRGSTKALLLQPAYAALQDEKKTTASERARNGLTQLYQGASGGTDTARLAAKIAKLLNGSYDDTVWLHRLAYFYMLTAVNEAATGASITVAEAEQETLVSTHTQAGFASSLADIVGLNRDVLYLDYDNSLVTDSLIAVATYLVNGITVTTLAGTFRPNLPRMNNPVVLVQGREAGIVRNALSTLSHEAVADLAHYYCSTQNCAKQFSRALKTMGFLMSRGVGGPSYRESYLLPASNMAAGVAGYLLTGPAAVVHNTCEGILTPGVHAFYEGTLRRMMFEATLNTLRHSAGVHHLTQNGAKTMPTIVAAWEMLLSVGREGGYAAALEQLASLAGWSGALGGLLYRHSFTTNRVTKIFDMEWARTTTQWAELLPWVTAYPTQCSILARLSPVRLVDAKVGVWQPIAQIVGRDGAADGFQTLMMEARSARVAAKYEDGLVTHLVEVARMNAVSTGWQADFSIPTVAPHLGGFSSLKARIDSDREIVRLMDLERRPVTTWKLRWHVDPKTIRTQDDIDNHVLSNALREAEVARTSMGAEAIARSKKEAGFKAQAGKIAKNLATEDIRVALMAVAGIPQYEGMEDQYDLIMGMSSDPSRSAAFMDAVRDLAEMLGGTDHIEAVKGLDPELRAIVTYGMAALCDVVVQAAETGYISSSLGRVAAGLRSVGSQLSEDPTLSLDELRDANQRELDKFAEKMQGAVLSVEEAEHAETVLFGLLAKKLKGSELAGSLPEGRLRAQLASGGNAQDWLASQPMTDEITAQLITIKDEYLQKLQWSVSTPTPETLAREAARNGNNEPELHHAQLPEQVSEAAEHADFTLPPSSAEAGSAVIAQTTETTVQEDTPSEIELPMRFEE
jgi:hypothetical protein